MVNTTEIKKVKMKFKPGMRVQLVKMDDIQAPPIGTEGTVISVDNIGSVMVAWDTGSSLNILLGFDEVTILNNL